MLMPKQFSTGHVPDRSSTDAPHRGNAQPPDLTEATAFRPVPSR